MGVLLGMPGLWAKDFREASDHYTMKIGGLPDWPFPREELDSNLIECRTCGSRLSLVAQVYAPINNRALKLAERVLYILGCLMPTCAKTPLSWRALRIQKSCIQEEKSNGARDSAVSGSKPPDSVKESNSWEYSDEDGDEDVDLEELGRALAEAATAASNHKKRSTTKHSRSVKKSSTANSSLRGNESNGTVLPCFYIYSQEETSKDVTSISLNCLFLSTKEKRSSTDDSTAQEESWEDDRYEYDRALTADRRTSSSKNDWMQIRSSVSVCVLDTLMEGCRWWLKKQTRRILGVAGFVAARGTLRCS